MIIHYSAHITNTCISSITRMFNGKDWGQGAYLIKEQNNSDLGSLYHFSFRDYN